MKLRYEIPSDKVWKGIRRLEVEEGDGGAYLFLYEDIESPSKWDGFHANIEEALSMCEETWGVERSDRHEIA